MCSIMLRGLFSGGGQYWVEHCRPWHFVQCEGSCLFVHLVTYSGSSGYNCGEIVNAFPHLLTV